MKEEISGKFFLSLRTIVRNPYDGVWQRGNLFLVWDVLRLLTNSQK